MACKMKKRNMNQGGVVNTLTQVLPTIGMVGQIGSAALGVVNMINENNLRKRQEATDAYMGTTNQYMGYQMGGAVDNPLSNTSVEVQGNPGIDTNPRMVANNAINVTEGEVINNNVNMGMGNSAFVFSNDRSMKDPVNGKTFAKSVKKYEKAKGRAEKRLEKYPFDNEAKNSIMFNQQMIDNTAQRQEEVKSMMGIDNDLPAFGMQYGGKVNYKQGGAIDPTPKATLPKVLPAKRNYGIDQPQRAMMGIITGTEQYPSDALKSYGVTNPFALAAADIVVDPLNLFGGFLSKVPKITKFQKQMSSIFRAANIGDNVLDSSEHFRTGAGGSYRMGGKVNYITGGVTNDPIPRIGPNTFPKGGARINYQNNTTIPSNTITTPAPLGMSGIASMANTLNYTFQNNPTLTSTAPKETVEKNPGFSTLGDYVYMAGKTAELIGKAAMARQPVRTYNVSDYQLAKPVYNPAMEQRMISDMVRSQTSQINTGNANLDRALASTMYTQGMNKSAEIAEKYRQLQATSDIGVNKANIDAALTIADRNEQNQAARFNAMDTVLSSIGTYGQAVQDMTNTRATNRITMNAINQMAQMYKISPENLLNIMRNNPAIRQQLEQLVTVR